MYDKKIKISLILLNFKKKKIEAKIEAKIKAKKDT